MCCHGEGEAWKEEVIPRTVGPVPTQDCGAWPHGSSSLKEFTKTLELEILKRVGSMVWDSSDIVWMETKARNVVRALEATKGLRCS